MILYLPRTVPGLVPEERTLETTTWLEEHRSDLLDRGLTLLATRGSGFSLYLDVMERQFDAREPFGILEHDVVPPSVDYLLEILECPKPLCSAPIEMHVKYNEPKNRPPGGTCSFKKCVPWDGQQPGTGFTVFGLVKIRPTGFGRVFRPRTIPGDCGPDSIFYSFYARDGGYPQGKVHLHPTPSGAMVRHNHPSCLEP